MIAPNIPHNEKARLAALRSYNILHTEKDEEFDQIIDLASYFTDMPISLISLVDENEVWFKSSKGMDICSSDRNLSFCSFAIGSETTTFVVNNALNHPEFKTHPYVTADKDPVVFYAGVCLLDTDGHKLGTLCVIDNKPNSLSERQMDGLKKLAKQIVKLIELHKANSVLKDIQNDLEHKNKELKNFAGIVSHDMKMPLANIIVTTDILKAKYAAQLDNKAIDYLSYLKQSSFTLSDYISGLLAHYESDNLMEQEQESFDIHHLLEEIIELLNINLDCEIDFPEVNFELTCNRAALEQIFLNLIGNSLKYNNKDKIIIAIDGHITDEAYYFTVTDNGIGIPKEKQQTIFKLFSIVGTTDRDGNKGSGIGLSTVKKLVTNLGGTIEVSSEFGKGTSFKFSIKR
ncbi:MAG: GAF domain-containing sensor histidine kinase [Marinirhabdus sp.]|nr:GAF domain-containing sensor histidine kinase [Marinirhabdus sp.]